jgi:hypothetical protein
MKCDRSSVEVGFGLDPSISEEESIQEILPVASFVRSSFLESALSQEGMKYPPSEE